MRLASLQERLQPALLDRLTDDEPGSPRESREKRVVSLARLQAAVLRDLSWLLNADNLCDREGLARFPGVRGTVLDYGLPPLAGRSASTLELADLEELLRRTIVAFEPRLVGDTVVVRAVPPGPDSGSNTLAFEIDALLWAAPLPLELFLRTEVDLESGSVSVSRAGSGRNP
jgi:type VI secretion system protein ImpF